MALWRMRTLSPDQKAEIAVEQEQEGNSGLLEDGGSFLMVEDAKMTKVYSMELHVNVSPMFAYILLCRYVEIPMSRLGSAHCYIVVFGLWHSRFCIYPKMSLTRKDK